MVRWTVALPISTPAPRRRLLRCIRNRRAAAAGPGAGAHRRIPMSAKEQNPVGSVKSRGQLSLTRDENLQMLDVIIYHNPECGTSRNVLGLIRNAGIEPHVIEYLKCPPSRALLTISHCTYGHHRSPAAPRIKGTPYHDLGLDDPSVSDDQVLDAMMAHPILINRPIVVTPLGVKLCRPSEAVLDLLPVPQRGEFRKEDGELVVDSGGNRVS